MSDEYQDSPNNNDASNPKDNESSTNNNEPKEEKSETGTTHINLKVSDGSAEIFFKIKRNTPMKRLMEAFCKRQGKDLNSLRFLIDGVRVEPNNTPDDLDLEDGDTIEAHRSQVGGGN
ncbi:SMT3 [Candida pseudojiufengensis]|uniref:SMT3 n=1 Tax=Candida pseudojiufengensis TaxID=497109 RepID=UPI0022250CD9|nr:SMT3 [Candida pseudojiufengensis]KAI5964596.1 SMT3 [Candida pseudojiufengensis]